MPHNWAKLNRVFDDLVLSYELRLLLLFCHYKLSRSGDNCVMFGWTGSERG